MTLSNPAQYISGRTVQEQMNSLIDYVDQRAADVALDAIASDVAQVHQDMLDADADAAAAAASAAAAAGTLANAVKKTGEASQSIAGDIAISGDLAIGGAAGFTGAVTVPAPANNTDAATKKYVDDQDALKISITNINNYAVGLTGNQTKAGILTATSPISGTAQFLTIDSSGSLAAGKYEAIVKLPRNVNYGIRQHFTLINYTRQRDRPADLLSLYINSSTAQGLTMIVRSNPESYTYVLSQDDDYIYVSILTTGTIGDAVQCSIIASTQLYTNAIEQLTTATVTDSPIGTELARLTP